MLVCATFQINDEGCIINLVEEYRRLANIILALSLIKALNKIFNGVITETR